MQGPLYGGNALMPGVHVKNLSTSVQSSGVMDIVIELQASYQQVDVNSLMAALRDAMTPKSQPGFNMTSSVLGSSSSGQMTINLDQLPDEVPLPGDEDTNGNGSVDPEEENLRMMIERRFDEVDQALRLLVDP